MTLTIAAMSDLHGYAVEIPPCDLVVIAGDVCFDRFGRVPAKLAPSLQHSWLVEEARKGRFTREGTPTLMTWGNHDWCEGWEFPPVLPNLHVLVDGEMEINGWRVWMTPWSNQFMDWAFMKEPEDLAPVYAAIPEGVEVLVSHQPPLGYGGRLESGEEVGSRELLQAIERVRPKVVICGHIHAGYGRYEHQGIPIYNVSVVDEQYRLRRGATMITLEGGGGER